MNRPTITPIQDIHRENNHIKTIYFQYNKSVIPGQFLMIWIPGIDEIPMSASYIDSKTKAITFKPIGEATQALFNLKKGDLIGVRGPYGNGFKLTGKHLLFIGGGTGCATLAPAVEQAIMKKKHATIVLGAQTKAEIFFEERLQQAGATVKVSTDDGSKGFKGYASLCAQEILKNDQIDAIITCGPELMMKSLLQCAQTIPFQASLERYMKCAFGLCGQCCIGNGLRVCKDGPIFDGKTLKNIKDFGVFRRDSAGRKVRF